ncbi:MAG: homoserine kinase [Bacteroidetes bacterium]|nr:homoserine kinase [Bacteroidota bacterium]
MESQIVDSIVMPENTPYDVAAWGPASLSNLGPGFDVLGLAIQGLGDIVSLRLLGESGFSVRVTGPEWIDDVPTNEELNTAAVAVRRLFRNAGVETGAEITIHKGVPLGSGIGGSAASAAAGAFAAAEAVRLLTGEEPDFDTIVQAALAGERIASGAIHGDNVVPSLVGGLCLVDPTNPIEYQRLGFLGECGVILLLPEARVLTKTARAILPDTVRLSSTASQAHRLASMLIALGEDDWTQAGKAMMSDDLVEPYRAAHVVGYETVRAAAIEAGAFACGLSGSGPAMFALTAPGSASTIDVGQAMLESMRKYNKPARIVCTRADLRGTRSVTSDDQGDAILDDLEGK